MRVINIVDSLSELNYGVWNAAIINASHLKRSGISTELWYSGDESHSKPDVEFVGITDTSLNGLEKILVDRELNALHDIIVTSGTWQFPSKWGSALKSKHFCWIMMPQGMLEPWPLKHKWLKKKIYYHLIEKHLIRNATFIRAVSSPEADNLKKLFPNNKIVFIPNGVKVQPVSFTDNSTRGKTRYLFLSRLHSKKNILALVEAWISSALNNNQNFEFIVAGPDQGEFVKIKPLIAKSSNVQYIGKVTGETKLSVLRSCTFYVLPSFSEGLPSAMLEAMSAGLIPIISAGCNFPDVNIFKVGLEVKTDKGDIKRGLEESASWSIEQRSRMSQKAVELIRDKYSLEAMTQMQLVLYKEANTQ